MVEKKENFRPVSLSEVKDVLSKISKDRKELLYEQRIALEHSQKFAKLSVTKTKKMINDLSKLDFLKKNHVYKIADILPITEDDVKTIFAKERMSLGKNEINKILEIVGKYYVK